MTRRLRLLAVAVLSLTLSGCLGTAAGAAASATWEVVKLPFTVTGAAVSAIGGDDEDERDDEEEEG